MEICSDLNISAVSEMVMSGVYLANRPYYSLPNDDRRDVCSCQLVCSVPQHDSSFLGLLSQLCVQQHQQPRIRSLAHLPLCQGCPAWG